MEFISEQIENGTYKLSPRRKGRSFVWNVVSEILKPDESILPGFVFCRTCSKLLKYTTNQTSNLSRHKCCKSIKDVQPLKTVSATDKNESIEKCTSWIIEDCQPFSAVNGTGFMKLVKFFIKIGATYGENVDVENLLPDATTISRNVKKLADEKKNRIQRRN